MKALFRSTSANLYAGLGAVIGVPGASDLLVGITWGDAEDIVTGLTGCVMACYLVYCALLAWKGGYALLDAPRTRRIGYAALALFVAGFSFDVAMTAQRVFG